MKNAMYPFECCVDLGKEEQYWFEDMHHDPSYAHNVYYSALAYFDVVKSQTFGPTAIMHTNKAIVLLQKKLGEPSKIVTDSILYVVLMLAMFSEALDDLETVEKHIHGLHQLIKLRGGIGTLSQKHSLQIKCCRFVCLPVKVHSPSANHGIPQQTRSQVCPQDWLQAPLL